MTRQEEHLQAVQDILDYSFQDPQILIAALTHASYADSRVDSNERLEFLGDAVLGMIVCHDLYERFPEELEGDLTKIKSAVVSRRTCAQIARKLGLPRYLLLGKGMSDRGQLPSSLAAAVYESVIAAIYIDSGRLAEAKKFVLRTITDHVTSAANCAHQRNFKSQLQQYAQKELSATPSYEIMDEQGPDHSKCFEVGVVINGRRYISAWGPSKKEAEQKAAYLALRELEVIQPVAEFEPESA